MKKLWVMTSLSFLILMFLPDTALASGISEFTTPLQKVMETITGTAGRIIAISAFALCGIIYVTNRNELSEGFKMLLGVVMGICFIAFAASIVDGLFSFSGATI